MSGCKTAAAFIVILVLIPLTVQSQWSIVNTMTSVFHRDMICYNDRICVLVGGITNPGNNFENGPYIGVSYDNGVTWMQSQYDLPLKVGDLVNTALYAITFTDSLHWYAAGAGGAVLISSDGAATWTVVPNIKKWIYSFLSFADSSHGIVASSFGGVVLKTTDAGVTWRDLSIASKPKLQKIFYASHDTLVALQGDVYANEMHPAILRSVDSGNSWESLGLDIVDDDPEKKKGIRPFDMVFKDAHVGFLAGRRDPINSSTYHALVLKTTNGGENWRIVLDSAYGEAGTTYEIQKLHTVAGDSLVAVCADGRILVSSSEGILWEQRSTPGLAGDFYRASAFTSTTHGYVADGLHQVHKYMHIPARMKRAQEDSPWCSIFPNPAKGNTLLISINDMPTGGTSLTVYNNLGEKLSNIYATTVSVIEGTSTLSCDISGLDAGVYFISIQTNGALRREKFLIIR